MSNKPWKKCLLCNNETFATPNQFGEHLRNKHSKREGGSHVCLFGPNGICPLLPYEGVSDRDYESHIAKCHIFVSDPNNKNNNQVKPISNNHNVVHHNQQSLLERSLSEKAKSFCFPLPSKPLLKPESNGLLATHDQWNIFSSSQNLTSILNDPLKPRSYYDNFFTKTWGFAFIEPHHVPPYATLKKSSNVLFENYLEKVVKRNRRTVGSLKSSSRPVVPNESLANQIVPSFFFQSSFNLEDSETFSQLLQMFEPEQAEEIDRLQTFFASNSMIDVQKILSDHLDVVEQDLAQQIGQRSKDFFQVMSSMDIVMERLKVAIKQVTFIREHCHKLKDSLVSSISVNIDKHLLRTEYRDIYRKINWIATVHQTQPTIQLLLSKNDYAGALDLISTSQEVVTQELSGVVSFRHLKLQLMEIEKVIERMMNEEFVKYLTAEWNRPVMSNGNKLESRENIQEERLLSIIYGMLKLQKFDFIDTFREEAFTAIKTNVKQTVIEILSRQDCIEISRIDANLFEQLECLDFGEWLKCLESVFRRLLFLLHRVEGVYDVISNGFLVVTNNQSSRADRDDDQRQADQPQAKSNGLMLQASGGEDLGMKVILQSDYYELSSNLKEILCSVCDFAHSRCAKIIELRVDNDGGAKIEANHFLELIRLMEGFVGDCANICSKKSPSLKLIIQLQSTKFVAKFHTERREKLKNLLDREQWKPANDVSQDFQRLCSDLVNVDSESVVEIFQRYKQQQSLNEGEEANIPKASSNNSITINDNKYVLVKAVINLMMLVLEYCQHAQEMSFLSSDLLVCLVDLLKLFNSRTSQLVLGAGALQIAGLKTISAKTLIISMRSLTFVTEFIPRIRMHFLAIIPGGQPKSLTKQFDEILELYENHCFKIPEKVISLVRDVILSNLKKWVAHAPVPSSSFQTISQHLTRLHDNIQDVMPQHDLIELFQRIHSLVLSIFRDHLVKLAIINDGGPQHGLVTQELMFYIQSLRNLSIGSKMNLSTEELWSKEAK